MFQYILKRIVSLFITLFILASITFFMMHAVPGGPFTTDRKMPPEIEQALMEKYDLHLPLHQQYINYMMDLLRLDLGPSFKNQGEMVGDMIVSRFPVSARVGGIAILLLFLIGIPAGLAAGFKSGTLTDRMIMVISTIGVVIPSFVVATILLYIFAVKLQWLPFYGIQDSKGYILPSVSLAGFSIAYFARLTRSSVLDVMGQDYITMADAKGLRKSTIIFKHVLKNAMIPVVTVLGPSVASLLTGTFVIEKIFGLPGIGRYFVDGISNRDYSVIMGITLFYALFLSVMVLVVDILYVLIDPRIDVKA
ncbi:ABC transporter permease [Fusibacter paucivorans]|uniref:ABC transporter permease n=1 Tax=Fusibacter paucivorans TaxID=76009 RepID=A0ABS5PUD3_9FIRM|nr:ABC transporter permease [Fusibacter paucivorans]MBS7527642.1 ABC transporter permease [Fusibacter paucivorans]